MKKLLFSFSILLLFAVSTFAQKQLTSFNDLMGALNSGKHVRMVFYYNKCKLISNNEEAEKVPDAIGGMDIVVYEYFAVGAVHNKLAFVVTSESKLIENPKGDGFVQNYVKVKVLEDGKVVVSAKYIDAKTYDITMDEKFFTEINNGKNDTAAYFYTE